LEEGHDGAPGTQNIAKADGDENGLRMAGQAFDLEFRQPFAGTIYACGLDGFVRGDHDKALCAVFVGELGDVFRADNVVLDDFFGKGFDEFHVFVRGCMKNDVGTEFFKDLAHSAFIANVCDNRFYRQVGEPGAAFEVDVVDALFAASQKKQLLRLKSADLAAEFRTDRAACAGDEHDLIVEISCDFFEVDIDFISAEQALNVEICNRDRFGIMDGVDGL